VSRQIVGIDSHMYMAVTLPLEPKCSVSKSVKGLRSLAMGVKVQNCTF